MSGEIDMDYDRLLYGEEEEPMEPDMKEVAIMCSRHEIGLFLLSLAKIFVEALNIGVKIIVDVEPIQYESAISLLSHAVYCSRFWRKVLTLKNKMTNKFVFIDLSMYVPTGSRDINVIIDRERKRDELMEKIDMVLSKSKQMYFYVASKPPEITFTSALYRRNLILDAVRKTLLVLDKKYGMETDDYRMRLKYVGRVPHEVVLLMPSEIVRSIAKKWVPPPPANADYLGEKYRPLKTLVLPEEFREILNQYLYVLRTEQRGSLMLVGLPGSGRKTIARSIAGELDLPAYTISIANILSRYVGESESKLKAFFDSMRARGGLAVFESIEALFRRSAGESVTPNLRSILFQQMAREDNNFIIVFTTTEEAPPEVFDSPLIGEVKMVVPLPRKSERQKLTRMFLREILGDKWGEAIRVAKKTMGRNDDEEAENILYSLYADVFVEPTIGFTPGEIYQVMRIILKPIIPVITKKRLIGIADMVIKYTKRDLSARQARIKQLIDRAISLGWFSIGKNLEKLYDELTRIALENREEEKK